jgi:hypothetical protein
MSTDIKDLVALLYRPDWTTLSLSAMLHFERDKEVERRLFVQQMDQMRPPPGPFGRQPPPFRPADLKLDDEGGAEDEEDEEELDPSERRVLIGSGGRYRITAADGRVLTVCDGSTRWLCSKHGARADKTTGKPAIDLRGLLTPRWLLTGYDLEITGEEQTQGRAAVAVLATPRGRWPGQRPKRYDLLDRVDVLADAELGILLSSEQIFQGHLSQATRLSDLVIDPAEAADDSLFTPPPGLTISDEEDSSSSDSWHQALAGSWPGLRRARLPARLVSRFGTRRASGPSGRPAMSLTCQQIHGQPATATGRPALAQPMRTW